LPGSRRRTTSALPQRRSRFDAAARWRFRGSADLSHRHSLEGHGVRRPGCPGSAGCEHEHSRTRRSRSRTAASLRLEAGYEANLLPHGQPRRERAATACSSVDRDERAGQGSSASARRTTMGASAWKVCSMFRGQRRGVYVTRSTLAWPRRYGGEAIIHGSCEAVRAPPHGVVRVGRGHGCRRSSAGSRHCRGGGRPRRRRSTTRAPDRRRGSR